MGRGGHFRHDVAVVGGCGHVGLPLSVALADAGWRVVVHDVSAPAVRAVRAGVAPADEPGLAAALRRALAAGQLAASADPAVVACAEHVIVVVAGPVRQALGGCAAHLRDGQALILRSTVPPGATAGAEKLIARLGIDVDVAYCPERLAEGAALAELRELPQIVASRTARGQERASRLFASLAPAIVPMTPEEAEVAKLAANAWRYLSFAAANELYMIASDLGLDYERIRRGVALGYPRAAGLPPAGLAGGPCLPGDTAALAAAHGGDFALGRAAIAVNEGLPGYLVRRLERRYELAAMTVGVLGVAFKGGCADTRGSLAAPLAGLLADRCRAVLRTDPLVTGPGLLPLADVLGRADLLVIAAPHPCYRALRTDKPVADIWNLLGRGVLV